MLKALHYDRKGALAKDDGEFWMDLDSAKHFYDVFHMNWNPTLFKHQYVVLHAGRSGWGRGLKVTLCFF